MLRTKKEIQIYFEKKKEFQNAFLAFIENEDDYDEYFVNLIKIIKNQKLQNSCEELQNFLYLIKNISDNYHRESIFLNKIEKILLFLKDDIMKNFSNSTIFQIVFKSKIMLFLLFKNNILKVEESMINFLLDSGEENVPRYCHFFLPEIRKFITKEKILQIENEILKFSTNNLYIYDYEEKRLRGENDSYICALIRNDSIEEFISYVNKNNIALTSRIKQSIYETNSFLIGKNPTLIEYASFFGSIRIFNYLLLNNVKPTSELWLYTIHSNNAEMIQLLEKNCIKPEDETFEKCLIESIKCHHNDVANYIYNSLLINAEINETYIENCIKYNNYSFIPKNYKIIDRNNEFFYLCKYNYDNVVKLFMKIKKKEIIEKIRSIYNLKHFMTFSLFIFMIYQYNKLLKKMIFIVSIIF